MSNEYKPRHQIDYLIEMGRGDALIDGIPVYVVVALNEARSGTADISTADDAADEMECHPERADRLEAAKWIRTHKTLFWRADQLVDQWRDANAH